MEPNHLITIAVCLLIASGVICFRNWRRIPVVFILLVMAAIAVLLVATKISNSVKNTAAANWPTVEGQVVSNRIVRSVRSDDDHSYFVYRPEITYTYVAQGRSYTGNQLTTNDLEGEFEYAHPKILEYPPGKSIIVFVDPENAAYAVLEPGGDVWVYSVFEICLGFFLLALISVILFVLWLVNSSKT